MVFERNLRIILWISYLFILDLCWKLHEILKLKFFEVWKIGKFLLTKNVIYKMRIFVEIYNFYWESRMADEMLSSKSSRLIHYSNHL